MKSVLYFILIVLLILLFAFSSVACGDDDDDERGSVYNPPDDDDTGADDDADDDLNDDADDDVDDDSDDDADDDTAECVDGDGDNYGENCAAGPDCNDTNEFIHPGAAELPDDGIDQDCDDVDLTPNDNTGIFVAKTGDDANPGTMTAPKLTVNAGTELAVAEGKSVFVAKGNYNEDVETRVSLFGGYESEGWTRDIEGYVTTISAQTSKAVVVDESINPNRNYIESTKWRKAAKDDANPVAIQGFTINGGSGEECYGVYIWDTATLANNIINGGSPADEEGQCFGVYKNGWDVEARLIENTIDGGGGKYSIGVYNYYGTAMLNNNIIKGCKCFYNHRGIVMLVNNSIYGGSGGIRSYGVINHEGTASLVGNDIDGGSSNSSHGVRNSWTTYGYDSTIILEDNKINGGSGILESTGVENIGTATLIANDIDGGTGGGSSYGVQNLTYSYDFGNMTLKNNFIYGGSGDEYSYGVTNFGEATLVNNVVNGGEGSNVSTGVCSYGVVTMLNNTVNGGAGDQESWAINVEYVFGKLANKVISGEFNAKKGDFEYSNDAVVPARLINNIIDAGSSENSNALQILIEYSDYMGILLVNNDIYGEDIGCMISEFNYGYASIECVANSISEVNDCTWFSCIDSSANISADPLFVDSANGDFHLQSGSPCIDTGINPTEYIEQSFVEYDFEGDPRPYGAGWDIGPDEWQPASE